MYGAPGKWELSVRSAQFCCDNCSKKLSPCNGGGRKTQSFHKTNVNILSVIQIPST